MARKTKIDWIKAGLQALEVSGEDALTIECLTKRLGVTKGSFYHHFSSRDDFCVALLQYWEKMLTEEVIRLTERAGSSQEKVRELTRQILNSGNHKLEVAIRAWALRDPLAGAFQERVDTLRCDYSIRLAEGLVADKERARRLGTMTFALFLGAQQKMPPIGPDELRELYREVGKIYALFLEET